MVALGIPIRKREDHFLLRDFFAEDAAFDLGGVAFFALAAPADFPAEAADFGAVAS